jgi:phage gp36-like protein
MDYCTKAQMEAIWGVQNVSQFADMDNDANPTTIASRIAAAITWASAEIDDYLRVANYRIPCTTLTGTVETVPTTVAYHAAVLAGVFLYEARGAKDYDTTSGRLIHQYGFRATRVRRFLEEIANGTRKLDAIQ